MHRTWKILFGTWPHRKKKIVSVYSTRRVLNLGKKIHLYSTAKDKELFVDTVLLCCTGHINYCSVFCSCLMASIYIQYKKPLAEKKLVPNLSSFNTNQIRMWWPNYHSHPPRGRSPPLDKERPPSRTIGVIIGAPLSDLITIKTDNIWASFLYCLNKPSIISKGKIAGAWPDRP